MSCEYAVRASVDDEARIIPERAHVWHPGALDHRRWEVVFWASARGGLRVGVVARVAGVGTVGWRFGE